MMEYFLFTYNLPAFLGLHRSVPDHLCYELKKPSFQPAINNSKVMQATIILILIVGISTCIET